MHATEPGRRHRGPKSPLLLAATLLAGAGTVVAALAGSVGRSHRGPKAAAASATSAPTTPSVAPFSPVIRWQAGTEQRFDLEIRSRVEADLGKLGGHRPSAPPARSPIAGGARVNGSLVLTVIGRTDDKVVLAVRVDEPVIQVRLGAASGPSPDLARALAETAVVTAHPSGRVLTVAVPTDVSPPARRLLGAILSFLQVAVPSRGSRPLHSWTVQEQAADGRYIARYRVLHPPAAPQVLLSKEKLRYLPAGVRPGELPSVAEPRPAGKLEVTLDAASGLLRAVKGTERLTTVVDGRVLSVARTVVRARRVALRQLTTGELESLRARARHAGPARPLFDPTPDQAIEATLHRERLGGATASELLERVARAEERPPSSERATLGLALESLVTLQPVESTAIGTALVRRDPESWAFRTLASALAEVGHEPAQRALLEAIAALGDQPRALHNLVPLLAGVPRPLPAVGEALRRLAVHPDAAVASMAQLALGAAARNLLEAEPNRARRIGAWAAKHLRAARRADRAVQWLLVLGNAGDAAPRALLLHYASDGRPTVRAAALWALRWRQGDEVDPTLARALRLDPVGEVRASAARALAYRPRIEATLAAQKAALGGDVEPRVRRAVLGALWNLRAQVPRISTLLRRVATADRDTALRQVATRLLATLESDGS